jgi:hypothetical protein
MLLLMLLIVLLLHYFCCCCQGSGSSESEYDASEHVERGPNDTVHDYIKKQMDYVHKRTYRREIKDYIKKKNLKKKDGETDRDLMLLADQLKYYEENEQSEEYKKEMIAHLMQGR